MQRPENSNKLNGVHPKRAGKPINESLNKRLAVYALAAGAAGVGLLALAQPAEASIVMGTGTPISIGVNTTEYLTITGSRKIEFIDTNSLVPNDHAFGKLSVKGLNGVSFLPTVLGANATISANAKGFTMQSTLAHNFSADRFAGVGGPWANENGYLGFEFKSNDKTYFGWAHLSVKANPAYGETGVISEFAYEACPDVSIDAGQTSGGPTCSPTSAAEPGALTLSLLALGALGLDALRRRKQVSGARG